MNILLIAPATGHWRGIARKRLFNGKAFRFSMLPLLNVAALSPRDATVTIIDEQVDQIPTGEFDVVGITAMTAVATRAYELCDHFRDRLIPVVMGGIHATLNADEALKHADAIVVGPAYGAWERVCEDVRRGQLHQVYYGQSDARVPVHLPRDLMKRNGYVTISGVAATMGCANGCKFCSITAFCGGQRLQRPVDEVVREIAALDQRFLIFVDDNLTQDRDYALRLFRAMARLRKQWVVQTPIGTAFDTELMSAMQKAGCIGVFVGLETFNEDILEAQDKTFNSPARYREAIDTFHRHGIYVEAGVIVGFDSDDTSVFKSTLSMLEAIGIDAIQLAILTPQPGTPLHHEMADRIVDNDLTHYDFRHAVYEPARMERRELQAGADWMIRTFYSPWRIAKRIPRWLGVRGGWRAFTYIVGLNLAYLGRVRRFGIRGYDPALEPAKAHAVATDLEPRMNANGL